ncbi:hypothetical protein H6F95_31855 [Cyanobacteria bacterium FACHB-471]|nr:hypothetical protein [Cyanobacteria bacterium FACHB-471]
MMTLFQSNGSKQPSIAEKLEAQQLELQRVSAQLQAQRERAEEEAKLLQIYEQSLENCQAEMQKLRKEQALQEAEAQLESDTQELRAAAQKINNLSEQLDNALQEFDDLLHSRTSLIRLQAEQKIMFANLREVERPNSLKDWWTVLPVVIHQKGEARFTIRYRFRKPNESGDHTDVLKQQRSKEKL